MAILEYKGTTHKIIFFHIGWMEHYRGKARITGSFGYLNNSKNLAGEIFNFKTFEGHVYGYVPNTNTKAKKEKLSLRSLNISRLNAKKNETEISNVTVIFFAPKPNTIAPYTEENFIVGWYKDATLFKHPQPNNFLLGQGLGADDAAYFAVTDTSNATCLPINKRNFKITSSHKVKGGYGQANVWYADDKENSVVLNKYLENVLDYIYDNKQPVNQTTNKTNSQWNHNLEERLKIEKIAVETTQKYFEENGYSVISVEKEAKGWDLQCIYDKTTNWLVEVKGTKSQEIKFELTPNEYLNMKKHIEKYKISIVINCLKNPKMIILSLQECNGEFFGYNIENNIKVTLMEKTGAIGKLVAFP